MLDNIKLSNRRLYEPYLWSIVTLGAFAFAYSCLRLDFRSLDAQFLVIALVTLFLSSRIIIPIPRFSSQISVSDTFIFLTLLLYGGDAAVLLAATEAFLSSRRFCKKVSTVAFNWGCAACATFITAKGLEGWFGDIVGLQTAPFSVKLVVATCTMALLQYAANSGFVAVAGALKIERSIWQTWSEHYLWTSITYFAGASAAAVIAKLIATVGFYAVLMSAPIIAIVVFTYRTYLKNIETSAAQATQAENHVAELSHYIAEQERIREQFSQLEKLSALGELASGVAHDFNNTLAGILGRAQLLLRTDDPEKIRRGLNIIIKSAEDGAKTVKRIQDFARQRKDHDFQPIVLDQLLLDVSEITRPRWKDQAEASNTQITFDLQTKSNSRVMGDDSELREVLVNMIFNAVDAMPNGGRLTLSAEDKEGSVVISVRDTGMGMDADVRSRVFDPFFTTKGKAGLGLGLAVSFGIVSRHQGTIEVDSELGHGAEFRIVLPIAIVEEIAPVVEHSSPAPTNAVSPSIITSGRESQPRILVVDDEAEVRDLLRDILELEGCRVYLAEGGREALAMFDSREFDGVFTDVGMPGMSGWELAHEIRSRSNSIPIAVVTGWGEAVGSNEQKLAGVDWVVTKPFRAERIAELAQEIRKQREIKLARDKFSIVAA
jgi:signal transduction histidine kinase/ActR/RegA family two-component response regulator